MRRQRTTLLRRHRNRLPATKLLVGAKAQIPEPSLVDSGASPVPIGRVFPLAESSWVWVDTGIRREILAHNPPMKDTWTWPTTMDLSELTESRI